MRADWGVLPDEDSYYRLIQALCRVRMLRQAQEVLREVRGSKGRVRLTRSMLLAYASGLSQLGEWRRLEVLLEEMRMLGTVPAPPPGGEQQQPQAGGALALHLSLLQAYANDKCPERAQQCEGGREGGRPHTHPSRFIRDWRSGGQPSPARGGRAGGADSTSSFWLLPHWGWWWWWLMQGCRRCRARGAGR